MAAYQILLSACDDSTEVVMDLSHKEAVLLECVAAATRKASEYNCQPVLTLTRVTEGASE